MALLNWTPNYSVNIQEIDSQHLNLVNLINTLHASMKEGKGKEVMGGIISELISYTKYHFTFEENLMNRHSFPGFSIHKTEHQNFTSKVIEFENNYKSGKVIISQEVLFFLKDWLINHIQVTDKKYSAFFNNAGVY